MGSKQESTCSFQLAIETRCLRYHQVVACTWPIDLLLHSRPVKRRHFVVDFAGNRFSEGNINQQLLHFDDEIISSIVQVRQSKTDREVKEEEEKKIKSHYWRLACHEQFENSSRLGVLNNRDPHLPAAQPGKRLTEWKNVEGRPVSSFNQSLHPSPFTIPKPRGSFGRHSWLHN